MKANRFMSVISIVTLIVIMLGSTFAWFAVNTSSDTGAVSVEAAELGIKLDILPLYAGNPLIPTNDSDIDKALENECVDIYGNGACSAYTIKVKNNGKEAEYVGNIKFKLEDILHFKYRVLDSQGNLYQVNTEVDVDTIDGQSLGNKFTLAQGEEKTFTLIMWLPNENYDQSDDDAEGRFGASVTYESSAGGKVTGSFSA